MSRIEDLIAKYCPDGVDFMPMGAVGFFERGTGLQKNQLVDQGIPAIHYGQIYTHYGNFTQNTISFVTPEDAKKFRHAKPGDVLVATTSENDEDLCKTVAWIGQRDLVFSGDCCRYSSELNAKYVSYFFASDSFQRSKRKYITGTKVRRIAPSALEKIKIPVPPLEVQDEIVRILDSFTQLETDLESELEAELEARRKQYQYCKDKLLSFSGDVPLLPLCDIADIGTGSSNTNEAIDAGKYPFFVRSQEPLRKNDYDFDETAIITAGDGVGVGKVYHYVDGKYALHQRAYRIHINTPSVCPKFFFHYMKSAFLPYIEKTMYHGSVPSIRRPMLNRFPVPVPPLSEQERIVAILDKFDALVNDLSSGLPAEIAARRKQYEYYRDQLLTFTPTK